MTSKLPGRLGSLSARDLMCQTLTILSATMSIEEATSLLRARRHSGGPVIDESGQLVGTLSVRDIFRTKQPRPAASEIAGDDSLSGSWVMMESRDRMPTGTVRDFMRRDPPSVTEHARYLEVVRLMCNNHMHRVPVVNAAGKLVGIISPMDLLAALVNATDEAS